MLLAYDAIAVLRSAWAVTVQQTLEMESSSRSNDCADNADKGPLCLLTPENLKQYCMEPKPRHSAVQRLMDLFMRALKQVISPVVYPTTTFFTH